MPQALSNLAVGTLVKDMDTLSYGVPIVFQVGDKNHAGYPGNSVTLVSHKVLKLGMFDARETVAGGSTAQAYGNNLYRYSNIRQFLNSSAASWFVAQTISDCPPTLANGSGENGYADEPGFLSAFSDKLKAVLLDTDIPVAVHDGTQITLTDKLFLMSAAEINLGADIGKYEGSAFPLFTNNSSRSCKGTPQCFLYHGGIGTGSADSVAVIYSLRTLPDTAYISTVTAAGALSRTYPYYSTIGLRPCMNVSGGTVISDLPDTDGVYIILNNSAPSKPSTISISSFRPGAAATLSTAGSVDPEGFAVNYTWERRVDSGPYVTLGTTSAKSITDVIPSVGTMYQARVKATDPTGLDSEYTTSTAAAIEYNNPPVITGTDQNLGTKADPFTYTYTITDAEAATQTLSVTKTLTNGTSTITLRTYTATAGVQNTIDLTSRWLTLLPGTHVLSVYVIDTMDGEARRNITFTRSVTRLAASRAITTDTPVSKVLLSLYPTDRPTDSVLTCQVTNNPFDAVPVWEDATAKVNRLVHLFSNKTVTGAYGVAYRFILTKGANTIEVSQVSVRFA